MLKIYGPSGFKPSTTDQILGRFNDVIRGRSFLFLDEVLFAGDRKAADAVKRLSTTVEGGIETKGLPIVECPIAVNLWLCSNHKDAAFIEQYDARYWVLDVSEHRIKDSQYFGALGRQIENGGCEAFAHYLIKLDVSDFKPQYDIKINTAAKREMIKQSINAFDARVWLEECCGTGRLLGRPLTEHQGEDASKEERWVAWTAGAVYSFAQLRDAYSAWQREVKSPQAPKPTPFGSLGEVLGKHGFEHDRTSKERRWKIPAAEVCLSALASPSEGKEFEVAFWRPGSPEYKARQAQKRLEEYMRMNPEKVKMARQIEIEKAASGAALYLAIEREREQRKAAEAKAKQELTAGPVSHDDGQKEGLS
jgi:hypothetical protein